MAWLFLFIFVASVAFQFSVAVTEVIFGALDQMDSTSGRILHMLFLIALHLGLVFLVPPVVRIWIREAFLGSAANLWIPSADARRLAVGLFVAVMGWLANVVSFLVLGRELSGVLFWGILLVWAYLCHAWIFRGSRPPQRGGDVAPPGE